MRVLYQGDIGLGMLLYVPIAPLRCCYKATFLTLIGFAGGLVSRNRVTGHHQQSCSCSYFHLGIGKHHV